MSRALKLNFLNYLLINFILTYYIYRISSLCDESFDKYYVYLRQLDTEFVNIPIYREKLAIILTQKLV